MTTSISLPRLGASLLLAASLSSATLTPGAWAQTARFVDVNSRAITGEVSQLSHVLLIQIPRPVVLDIGAKERTTLTVPSLSEIIINGQKIAPTQTPVLISVEPAKDGQSAVVKAKGLMLEGKLVALDAEGDLIPTFVVNKKDFNDRVKAAMNLGATIGSGLAGTMGVSVLGALGKGMGDPTGANLANQITSTGGLLGIVSGLLGDGGGKRIIELQANSTHVLTIRNPAMVVAQLIQLNREVAAGNQQLIQNIGSTIRTGAHLAGAGGTPPDASDAVAARSTSPTQSTPASSPVLRN